jgi:hypothetical protein
LPIVEVTVVDKGTSSKATIEKEQEAIKQQILHSYSSTGSLPDFSPKTASSFASSLVASENEPVFKSKLLNSEIAQTEQLISEASNRSQSIAKAETRIQKLNQEKEKLVNFSKNATSITNASKIINIITIDSALALYASSNGYIENIRTQLAKGVTPDPIEVRSAILSNNPELLESYPLVKYSNGSYFIGSYELSKEEIRNAEISPSGGIKITADYAKKFPNILTALAESEEYDYHFSQIATNYVDGLIRTARESTKPLDAAIELEKALIPGAGIAIKKLEDSIKAENKQIAKIKALPPVDELAKKKAELELVNAKLKQQIQDSSDLKLNPERLQAIEQFNKQYHTLPSKQVELKAVPFATSDSVEAKTEALVAYAQKSSTMYDDEINEQLIVLERIKKYQESYESAFFRFNKTKTQEFKAMFGSDTIEHPEDKKERIKYLASLKQKALDTIASTEKKIIQETKTVSDISATDPNPFIRDLGSSIIARNQMLLEHVSTAVELPKSHSFVKQQQQLVSQVKEIDSYVAASQPTLTEVISQKVEQHLQLIKPVYGKHMIPAPKVDFFEEETVADEVLETYDDAVTIDEEPILYPAPAPIPVPVVAPVTPESSSNQSPITTPIPDDQIDSSSLTPPTSAKPKAKKDDDAVVTVTRAINL